MVLATRRRFPATAAAFSWHARNRSTLSPLPQLYSRLGLSHNYRSLGRDELLFVLDRQWKHLGTSPDVDNFTDAQAVAAIERITRENFRLLERLCPQIKRVMRINQLETIADNVVEAAASLRSAGNAIMR